MAATGEMSVVERLKYLLDTGQFADVNIRVGQGNNATVFKVNSAATYLERIIIASFTKYPFLS